MQTIQILTLFSIVFFINLASSFAQEYGYESSSSSSPSTMSSSTARSSSSPMPVSSTTPDPRGNNSLWYWGSRCPGENEVFMDCAFSPECEPTCENPQPSKYCRVSCAFSRCHCELGYVRALGGDCVEYTDCPCDKAKPECQGGLNKYGECRCQCGRQERCVIPKKCALCKHHQNMTGIEEPETYPCEGAVPCADYLCNDEQVCQRMNATNAECVSLNGGSSEAPSSSTITTSIASTTDCETPSTTIPSMTMSSSIASTTTTPSTTTMSTSSSSTITPTTTTSSSTAQTTTTPSTTMSTSTSTASTTTTSSSSSLASSTSTVAPSPCNLCSMSMLTLKPGSTAQTVTPTCPGVDCCTNGCVTTNVTCTAPDGASKVTIQFNEGHVRAYQPNISSIVTITLKCNSNSKWIYALTGLNQVVNEVECLLS